MKFLNLSLAAVGFIVVFAATANCLESQLQISSPHANSVVPGEVIELTGAGADPTCTLIVEVLTNDWYPQDGVGRINGDGSWTYSPVHLAGKGIYNNHAIRVTEIKDGHRIKSVTISGIARKQ